MTWTLALAFAIHGLVAAFLIREASAAWPDGGPARRLLILSAVLWVMHLIEDAVRIGGGR